MKALFKLSVLAAVLAASLFTVRAQYPKSVPSTIQLPNILGAYDTTNWLGTNSATSGGVTAGAYVIDTSKTRWFQIGTSVSVPTAAATNAGYVLLSPVDSLGRVDTNNVAKVTLKEIGPLGNMNSTNIDSQGAPQWCLWAENVGLLTVTATNNPFAVNTKLSTP